MLQNIKDEECLIVLHYSHSSLVKFSAKARQCYHIYLEQEEDINQILPIGFVSDPVLDLVVGDTACGRGFGV